MGNSHGYNLLTMVISLLCGLATRLTSHLLSALPLLSWSLSTVRQAGPAGKEHPLNLVKCFGHLGPRFGSHSWHFSSRCFRVAPRPLHGESEHRFASTLQWISPNGGFIIGAFSPAPRVQNRQCGASSIAHACFC